MCYLPKFSVVAPPSYSYVRICITKDENTRPTALSKFFRIHPCWTIVFLITQWAGSHPGMLLVGVVFEDELSTTNLKTVNFQGYKIFSAISLETKLHFLLLFWKHSLACSCFYWHVISWFFSKTAFFSTNSLQVLMSRAAPNVQITEGISLASYRKFHLASFFTLALRKYLGTATNRCFFDHSKLEFLVLFRQCFNR